MRRRYQGRGNAAVGGARFSVSVDRVRQLKARAERDHIVPTPHPSRERTRISIPVRIQQQEHAIFIGECKLHGARSSWSPRLIPLAIVGRWMRLGPAIVRRARARPCQQRCVRTSAVGAGKERHFVGELGGRRAHEIAVIVSERGYVCVRARQKRGPRGAPSSGRPCRRARAQSVSSHDAPLLRRRGEGG